MLPTPDTITRFWNWFSQNNARLRQMTSADDPFWDNALEQLHKVHPEFYFEMSGVEDEVREFIVTAGGNQGLFSLVEQLTEAATVDSSWKVVALKPRMGFDFVTDYEGVRFDPSLMWFLPLESASRPESLGLRIGIPGLTDANKKQAAKAVWGILDTGLGERSAATDVDHVEFAALPQDPEREGYIELPELPAFIDWRRRKLRAE